MATTTIVYKAKKLNQKGVGQLFVQLIKNRQVALISTGLKIAPNEWDQKRRMVKANHPNSARLNSILDQKKQEVMALVLKCMDQKLNLSSAQLKELFDKEDEKKPDFFSFSEVVLKRYTANDQIATFDKNKSSIEKLKKFNHGKELPFEEFDFRKMADFESYLRSSMKNKPSTIAKDLRFYKKVFKDAVRERITDRNLLEDYTIKGEPVERTYLTKNEVIAFNKVETEGIKKQSVHKDIFMFMASTGFRISDSLLLRWENIDEDRIHFQILKTGRQLNLKISAWGQAIINKYKAEAKSSRFVFPLMPDMIDLNDARALDLAISRLTALVNKSLKSLGKKAGITKKLSCHVGRHTYSMNSLPITGLKTLSQLLGHSSVRETEVYARMTAKEMDLAVDQLADLYGQVPQS